MRELFLALALVLVIEGTLFAAFPEAARRRMAEASRLPAPVLRWVGAASVLGGMFAVWFIRRFVA